MHIHGLAGHRGFAGLVTCWLALMVLCSFALYAAEHGINKAIESPFDALWWGVVTISTVGYGDVYPITPEGRLVAIILMLLGIGLFLGDHRHRDQLPARYVEGTWCDAWRSARR